MHHITKLMAAIVFGLALAACGGGGGDSSNRSDTNTTSGGQTSPTDSTTGDSNPAGSDPTTPPPSQPTVFTVTPSVNGTGGSISPAAPVTVNAGAAATFTLIPDTGYTVASVEGTCGGTLNGTSYATQAVNANCTVVVSFAQQQTADGTTSVMGPYEACLQPPTNRLRFTMLSTAADGTTTRSTKTVELGTYNGYPAVVTTGTNELGSGKSYTPQPLAPEAGYFMAEEGTSSVGSNTCIFRPTAEEWSVIMAVDAVTKKLQPGDSFDTMYSATTTCSSGSTSKIYRSLTTFIGIETLTLGGKTFPAVCHTHTENSTVIPSTPENIPVGGISSESWWAPGYGPIKTTTEPLGSGTIISTQYDGDF